MLVGIDALSMYTPGQYLALEDMAAVHNVDAAKYLVGIGQHKMSVPASDEDVVTMAAEAAQPIVTDDIRSRLSTVIFATESSVDQSKSSGLFLKNLLDIPSTARFIEMKQACYSATAGIQLACDLVRQRPDELVLVLASDIARYEQGGTAECTQGAGAIAILIASKPRILALDPETGVFSQDVMDFWRPNHRRTALVDGKLSIDAYETTIANALSDYVRKNSVPLSTLARYCFHLPYTKMASKALNAMKNSFPEECSQVAIDHVEEGLHYGREIGNTYTASLYISLLSMLERTTEDLSGKRIGLFSYGSGSVGEFFTGIVQPGYLGHLPRERHFALLSKRRRLDYTTYAKWFYSPEANADTALPCMTRSQFRLEGVYGGRRTYGVNPIAQPAEAQEERVCVG